VSSSTYVIRGGLEGRERLRVLARVMWPTTSALFSRVGIEPTARCLDVGCGGGDVTRELAQIASEGFVVGADLDATNVALARAETAQAGMDNVEFRVDDVVQPPADDQRFDVVYARFLFTHLADPAKALENITARVDPGGVLVVEDIDCSAHFCYPPSAAFARYVDWYIKTAHARGCDPNIGPRLPGLLRDAGLGDIAMNVVQPAGFSGEVKLIAPITMEMVADAMVAAEVATSEQVSQTIDELYAFANTEGTVQSLPRVVQTWGRRAS
jgi:SAM-dependent methyltransferase